MTEKEWIDGGEEFLPPQQILGDLTEDQATARVPGALYSIAQIVAHMHYWQKLAWTRHTGEPFEKAAHLEDTFAAPEPGGWDSLRAAFLSGLEEVKSLPDRGEAREAGADYDYAARALHNAYHLGQIATLRQIQDLWPPEGGEDYVF